MLKLWINRITGNDYRKGAYRADKNKPCESISLGCTKNSNDFGLTGSARVKLATLLCKTLCKLRFFADTEKSTWGQFTNETLIDINLENI